MTAMDHGNPKEKHRTTGRHPPRHPHEKSNSTILIQPGHGCKQNFRNQESVILAAAFSPQGEERKNAGETGE
jgi:hypothetical protein